MKHVNSIELSDSDIESVKKIALDILTEIDKICRENNLKYSLASGTLLGAVRHKGFIPWDDDVDIVMLYEDYQKFLEIANSKLDKKFYIATPEKSDVYSQLFTKVMAKSTVFGESYFAYSKGHPNGIFVDIFPLYPTDNIYKHQKRQNITAKICKSMLYIKSNYFFNQTGMRLLYFYLRRFAYFFIPRKFIIKKFKKSALKYNSHQSDYAMALTGLGSDTVDRSLFKKEWFESLIDIDFEGHKFYAFSDYDTYLKHLFSDYMKLPPKEERHPHHYVNKFEVKNYNEH